MFVPGLGSHLDLQWADPAIVLFLGRLASFSRLIMFDKRGTGLSDPVSGVPTPEERMRDMLAVMDATKSQRAALFGFSEGGPLSILFTATYPERVDGLILWGTFANGGRHIPQEYGQSDACAVATSSHRCSLRAAP